MSQATSTPTSATSRRKALRVIAGVTGAATMVTPAIAAAGPTHTEPDPIFAAIDARKQTYARYCEAHTRWCDDGEEPGALEEQSDEACYADNEALIAVLSTRPTTIAGTLALLEYLRALDEQQDNILEICDPSYDLDDDGFPPREGFAYRTLLNSLIGGLRPLAAQPAWFRLRVMGRPADGAALSILHAYLAHRVMTSVGRPAQTHGWPTTDC
jgi:hypothetical protein